MKAFLQKQKTDEIHMSPEAPQDMNDVGSWSNSKSWDLSGGVTMRRTIDNKASKGQFW